MAISLRIAMPIAVLSALIRAMAIAVLRALIRAMTISLRIAMPLAEVIAVRNAVLTPLRNAVHIGLSFSIPDTIIHAVLSTNLYKAL